MKIEKPQHLNSADALISATLCRVHTGISALAEIAIWDDLPAERRQTLAGHVRRAATICRVPLEGMTMTCAWLNGRFYAERPMAHGLSRGSFSNIASALRFVLERLGEHEPRDPSHDRMDPTWKALVGQLADANHRAGLVEFARYCSGAGLAPVDVRSDAIVEFEMWATDRLLHRNVRRLALNVERCWRKAQQIVPDWPPVGLHLPRVKGQLALPLEAFPASFADDLGKFCADMAGDRRGRPTVSASPGTNRSFRARIKPLRPRTIETRRDQALAAARALVGAGIAPERIASLRDLVDPIDHAEQIFEHFWAKAHLQPSSNTAGIGAVLKRIACVYCDPPVPGAAQISRWAKEMTPPLQKGLTAKNRTRLSAMVQPAVRSKLLNLPEELALRARAEDVPAKTARSLMLAAVALEILLHCPLRLENLRKIRLGVELRRLDPHSLHFTHLSISEASVKNSQPIEWRLTPDTSHLITQWLNHFRVVPRAEDAIWLFPGRAMGAMSSHGLYSAIAEKVIDTLGVKVNPHLFRHFAVWLHLKHHPGDYETARRLLGHSTVETTIRFYAGLEAEAAAERHDAIVHAERREGRGAAKAAFRKSRPRRRANRTGRNDHNGESPVGLRTNA